MHHGDTKTGVTPFDCERLSLPQSDRSSSDSALDAQPFARSTCGVPIQRLVRAGHHQSRNSPVFWVQLRRPGSQRLHTIRPARVLGQWHLLWGFRPARPSRLTSTGDPFPARSRLLPPPARFYTPSPRTSPSTRPRHPPWPQNTSPAASLCPRRPFQTTSPFPSLFSTEFTP